MSYHSTAVGRAALALAIAFASLGVGQGVQARPARDVGGLSPNVTPGPTQVDEVEPNDSTATAMVLGGLRATIKGYIWPNGEADYYSFQGTAGDRVYAAAMTAGSANITIAGRDAVLDLIAPDGVTVLETDNDDGSFAINSPSIAGSLLTASGTYYLRVRPIFATTIRPYVLHVAIQTSGMANETEPNNDPSVAMVLPASGWVSGTVTAANPDYFQVVLNAGDTVFASLDADPERDGGTANLGVGIGQFDNAFLYASDASLNTPNSRAHFMTAGSSGVYYVAVTTTQATLATYQLSVSVSPQKALVCAWNQVTPNLAIADAGTVTSTITVGGNMIFDRLAVWLSLAHANMPDLDVTLYPPDGNAIVLFTDIGASTNPTMNVWLADDAALPIGVFASVNGMAFRPEPDYLLGWASGQLAAGTWKLVLRDDVAGNTGTLYSWKIETCYDPTPPACSTGTCGHLYKADFENGASGYTHSGTFDQWALGLPSAAPIDSCHSGSSCFKTNLTGNYSNNASQDLFSPPISLAPATDDVLLSWWMKYQLEDASYDHGQVDVIEVGNPGHTRTVWRHYSYAMDESVGNPFQTIQESAGWGRHRANITDFAGKTIQLRFHIDSDSSVNYAGMAIDDIEIFGRPSAIFVPIVWR